MKSVGWGILHTGQYQSRKDCTSSQNLRAPHFELVIRGRRLQYNETIQAYLAYLRLDIEKSVGPARRRPFQKFEALKIVRFREESVVVPVPVSSEFLQHSKTDVLTLDFLSDVTPVAIMSHHKESEEVEKSDGQHHTIQLI